MKQELKRRNLSGIYIFDQFPGEDRQHPTCVEDCQKETRRAWCMEKSEDYLREVIEKLAKTFKDVYNYLAEQDCVLESTRQEFFKMVDRNVAVSKSNWGMIGQAILVDRICEAITLLADPFGVEKAFSEQREEDEK